MAFTDLDISVSETYPGPTPVSVCVSSGIQGDIETQLVVTMDILDGKAGEAVSIGNYNEDK